MDMILDDFLARYEPEMRTLTLQTRALVQEVLPGLVEMLDPSSNMIGFGTARTYKGMICGICTFPRYINLMFAQGATLPDPAGLLTGTGKKARHVRIQSADDLAKPELRVLLEIARAVHG